MRTRVTGSPVILDGLSRASGMPSSVSGNWSTSWNRSGKRQMMNRESSSRVCVVEGPPTSGMRVG